MPEPYNYTFDLPKPPADTFLQDIMGIQQLKGLRQQQQLAQQQAQFAAQMHPLEMARVQAGINASNASAAHSGAATGLVGVQTEAARLGLEENRRKNQDLATYQNEALKLAEDPTSWNATDLRKVAMKAAVLDPQSFSAMNNLFSHLPQTQNLLSNAASEVILSVNSGKPDIASSSLDKYIGAAQSALEKNPEDKSAQASLAFLNGAKGTLNSDPTGSMAALQASNFLFNTDPAKWDATTKALKGAGDIAKIQAETEEAKAKTKKALGEIPGQDKSLPSAILRDNVAIEKKVTAANEMADKLSQAAEAMRALPSVGSAKEWWTNVKPKLGFGENPEIAVRSNAAQLAGLGMLGAESSAMGGAIRSNVQFQYATSKLPDAWSAPQELAKRLDAQAEVQRKLAQIMTIDAEWNSAFRGSQKATKDEQILGMDVAPGTTKAQFKESAAKQLFPPSEPPKPPKPPAANKPKMRLISIE